MSTFLEKIKDAEHTFASFFVKAYQTLVKEEPKIQQVAGAVLKYSGAALGDVVAIEGNSPEAAQAAKVISTAQSDLTVAGSLIYDFGASPSAATILNGVQSNLGGLVSATGVKNPNSVAIVNKVAGEVGALATAVSAAVAPPSPDPQA